MNRDFCRSSVLARLLELSLDSRLFRIEHWSCFGRGVEHRCEAYEPPFPVYRHARTQSYEDMEAHRPNQYASVLRSH